jgi:hypothetical protein
MTPVLKLHIIMKHWLLSRFSLISSGNKIRKYHLEVLKPYGAYYVLSDNGTQVAAAIISPGATNGVA